MGTVQPSHRPSSSPFSTSWLVTKEWKRSFMPPRSLERSPATPTERYSFLGNIHPYPKGIEPKSIKSFPFVQPAEAERVN